MRRVGTLKNSRRRRNAERYQVDCRLLVGGQHARCNGCLSPDRRVLHTEKPSDERRMNQIPPINWRATVRTPLVDGRDVVDEVLLGWWEVGVARCAKQDRCRGSQ